MFWFTFFKTFLLSLILSVDDLTVGVAYGERNTKIPLQSLLIIVVGSTLSMVISMILGSLATSVLSDTISKYLSCILLVGLGCRTIYNAWEESKESKLIRKTVYSKWSDSINFKESFFLGMALGIDDFGEALGLAIAGFPIALTVFFFKLSEVIAILSGQYLGEKQLSKFINSKLAFIPGLTLMLVGFWQLH